MKHAPVSSTSNSPAKATASNPHAKGGSGVMPLPGGMGGQHLRECKGDGPKLSKLD